MSNIVNNKKLIIAIGIIVMLGIMNIALAVYSIALMISRNNIAYSTNLGQDITVQWDGKQDIITSMIYYPSSTPSGVRYKQNIKLKTSLLDQNYFVRASVANANSGTPIEGIGISSDIWKKNDDGYYYLNALVTNNSEISFAKSITTESNLSGDSPCMLIVIFQFLPSNLDVYTIWDIDRAILDITSV